MNCLLLPSLLKNIVLEESTMRHIMKLSSIFGICTVLISAVSCRQFDDVTLERGGLPPHSHSFVQQSLRSIRSALDLKYSQDLESSVWFTPDQIGDLHRRIALGDHIAAQHIRTRRQAADKWQAEIPYVIQGFSDEEENNILAGLTIWESKTCLQFKMVDDNFDDDTHIVFVKGDECTAHVGKQSFERQPIMFTANCTQKTGSVAHEVGRTLGLHNEHQRPDRDDYVQVLTDNMDDTDTGRYLSITVTTDEADTQEPYDYSSLMHYYPLAFSNNGCPTIQPIDKRYMRTLGQKNSPSFLDYKTINRIYCSDTCDGSRQLDCQNGGYQDPTDCDRCHCPDGIGGSLCERLQDSNRACGGAVYVYPGVNTTITSPNYAAEEPYMEDTACNWVVQAPRRHRVSLSMDGEDFCTYCEYSCVDWLEINDQAQFSTPGPRLCCCGPRYASATSNTTQMLLLFRSQLGTPLRSRRGFMVKVTAVPDNNVDDGPLDTEADPCLDGSCATATTTRQATDRPTTARPATTTTATSAAGALDLVFMLDGSGSVGSGNWESSLEYVAEYIRDRVDLSADGTRVGVMSHASVCQIHVHLNESDSADDIWNKIKDLRLPGKKGNTAGGLELMVDEFFTRRNGDRPGVPNMAVVFIDGASVAPEQEQIDVWVVEAHRIATVVAVGITRNADLEELNKLASTPDLVKQLDSFSDLSDLSGELDTISQSVSGGKPDEKTTIRTTTAKVSTTTENEDSSECVNGDLFLVFVLDSSGGVGSGNWKIISQFVKTVVNEFGEGFEAGTVNVAVITYSGTSSVKIDFDDFDNINELSAAILNLRHLGSTTNTAAALRNLREDLLGSIPSGSSTVAVVMTDAPSNRDSDEVGPQAEMARDEGVTFIAVGFTDAIVNEPEELHLITGRSDQELIITIPDYSGFSGTAYTEQLTNLIQRESGTCEETDSDEKVPMSPTTPTTTTMNSGSSGENWNCTFESPTLCGMSNVTIMNNETDVESKMSWRRHSGRTSSDSTGPDKAHSGMYYLYIETSNGDSRTNDLAMALVPRVLPVGGYCLRFSYHMYGFHIRSLAVLTRPEGLTEDYSRTNKYRLIWMRWGEQGEDWVTTSVDVTVTEKSEIVFLGTRGHNVKGDIAIDDISLNKGSC